MRRPLVGRRACYDRGQGEADRSSDERVTASVAIADGARCEIQGCEGERIGEEDPLLAGEAEVEVALDRRERDDHYRRVDEGERGAEDRRHQRQRPAPLGLRVRQGMRISRRTMRGMLAGIVAAAVWASAEPLLGRALRRTLVLGPPAPRRAVPDGPGSSACDPPRERSGVRGLLRAPRRSRAGEGRARRPGRERRALAGDGGRRPHPPGSALRSVAAALRNGRVFAYEVAAHALFGAVLRAPQLDP